MIRNTLAGLALFLVPSVSGAAIASAAVTSVTDDIGTYTTLVSTVGAVVITVVLARAGWMLLKRLVRSFS